MADRGFWDKEGEPHIFKNVIGKGTRPCLSCSLAVLSVWDRMDVSGACQAFLIFPV